MKFCKLQLRLGYKKILLCSVRGRGEGIVSMLKKLCLTLVFFLFLCFSLAIFGNESATTYFPGSVGSYWVYVDQDGNEITRESVEDKVVPAQTFHAFSYEPAVEEWFDYIPHFQPDRFRVDDGGVTLHNSNDIGKFIKARLTKEIEMLILMDPPEDVELEYEVTSDVSERSLFLPLPIELNEEWDTSKILATLELNVNDPSDTDDNRMTFDFSVVESGAVVNTETVETPAGTFEDCIKIEYRTETELIVPLAHFKENPPGEMVTTLWLAPNVGIVKCHREMEDMLLKTMPNDEIPFTTTINTLELKKYEINPSDVTKNTNYFPVSPGSYWVYVDQDGNEMTRRAIEDVVIPEKRQKAINYKPSIDEWSMYGMFTHPKYYEVTEDGLVFHAKDEAAKAIKTRLNRELGVIVELTYRIDESTKKNTTSQEQRRFEIKHEVEVTPQEILPVLPNTLTPNDEWDVAEFKVNINIQYFHKNTQNRPNNRPFIRNLWDITIVETGKVVGRESLETPAGKFDDCLKVEFRSETTIEVSVGGQTDSFGTPGETTTTIWFAPHIGIVKVHKQSEKTLLKALSKSLENLEDIIESDLEIFNAIDVKTLELKSYEIKTNTLE